MGQGDLDALHIHAAAFVDASGILYAFGLEPARQLDDGDHAWSGGFGDIDSIGSMIKVAVGDEHEIELVDLLEVIRAGGIALCPGVDQDSFASWRYEFETNMPQPRDLHAFHINLLTCHSVPPLKKKVG